MNKYRIKGRGINLNVGKEFICLIEADTLMDALNRARIEYPFELTMLSGALYD